MVRIFTQYQPNEMAAMHQHGQRKVCFSYDLCFLADFLHAVVGGINTAGMLNIYMAYRVFTAKISILSSVI